MPGKIGRALASRPVFERDITRTVAPDPINLPLGPPSIIGEVVDPNAPGGPIQTGGSPRVGNQIIPPLEQQTETQQIRGAPRGLTFLADFLSEFGRPGAGAQQQALRAQGVNRQFDLAQEQANQEALLGQRNFQRDVALSRLGFEGRRVALREREATRPRISTFQSRDGNRLLTVNTETGELINNLNLGEALSPQKVADFISNFENALGSPLNPNEQAIVSNAGQSALQQGDLGIVANALDGIASGREGFRRGKKLAGIVGDRQIAAAERKGEIEQRKNDRVALQAERSAILVENKEIRKQINTLKRDLFIRRDMRGSQRKQVEVEIKRLTGSLVFNDSQITELDKQILQLSGKKSLLRKSGIEEKPKKRLERITPTQPGTAEDFIRTESGKP